MSREELLIRVTGALAFGYVVCLMFVLAAMGWWAVLAEGWVGAVFVWVAMVIVNVPVPTPPALAALRPTT